MNPQNYPATPPTGTVLAPLLADLLDGQTCTLHGRPLTIRAAVEHGNELVISTAEPTGHQGGPGPDPADVDALRDLLDLTAGFRDNDQRARYLLSCDWMQDRAARPASVAAPTTHRARFMAVTA